MTTPHVYKWSHLYTAAASPTRLLDINASKSPQSAPSELVLTGFNAPGRE